MVDTSTNKSELIEILNEEKDIVYDESLINSMGVLEVDPVIPQTYGKIHSI